MSSRTSTNPKLASRGKSSDGPKGVAGGKRGGTRAASGKARANRNAGAVAHPMAQSPGILKFYTDDAPGIKIGPTTVLVLSLLFIGFVVLLHIWGKFQK